MFRTKLLWLGAVFLTLLLTMGGLALWVTDKTRYHFERSQLANAVHSDYLRLSAQTQALFKQLIDLMLTGDPGDQVKTERLRSEIETTLDAIREEIASEIAFVTDEEEEADEKAELALLARIEKQLNNLLAQFDAIRSLDLPGRFTEAEMARIQTLERGIDSDFRALVDEALLSEQEELEATERAATALLGSLSRVVKISLPIGLLLGGGALFLIWQRLRAPLEDLTRGTRALTDGELAFRLPVRGRDEFAHIAAGFNQMAQEIASHRQQLEENRDALARQVDETTQELQAANEALRQTDATRRRFFADISHELRTPITVIRGESQVALRGAEKSPEEYRDALQRVREQAELLGRLVDDLLFIARTDAGAARLRREAVALDALVGQVCGDAEVVGKSRHVGVDFQGDAGRAVVRGDPGRLRQLFMILLENAIQYSHPDSHVTVATMRAMNGVAVRVTNTGIGIAPRDLELVFERFYRGDNAAAMYASGSGLGLPVAKAIVDAHGGTITAESTLGGGTTFTVTLPLAGKLHAVA